MGGGATTGVLLVLCHKPECTPYQNEKTSTSKIDNLPRQPHQGMLLNIKPMEHDGASDR